MSRATGISVDDLSGAQRDAFIQAKQLLEARQCLLDIGYAISEPPSIDTFIESWATGPWSPYLEVADMTTQQEWQDANEKCPQTPQ